MDKTKMRPFGMRDKVAYAMGDVGCNVSFALNSYLMLFYTQYIGLSITTWGVIILALKIWDAINDPIMGGLMDSLKPGKRGKFKTYIHYGSICLLVTGAMCFLPIPNAPTWVKIVVCVVGYLTWDMSYTLANVPYGAMSTVITSDPVERTELSTWRSIGSVGTNAIIMIAMPILIFSANDEIIGGRMLPIAIILGVIGFLSFRFLLSNTVERVETVVNENAPREKYNYFKAMSAFFHNGPAVAVTLASVFQLIAVAGMTTCSLILFQSYFKNAQLSGVMSIVSMAPMILAFPVAKGVVKRFGKKEASAVPLLLSIVAGGLMTFLPIPPTMNGLMIWVALTGVHALGQGIFMVVVWAMVADSIDYQEMKSGKREEGTVYAVYSLGRKLAQGFGASIIAFLLAYCGYVSTLGAQQTAETAANVRVLAGAIQFVSAIGMYAALQFGFKLNKKQVEEMQIKLGHHNIGESDSAN